MSLPGDLEGLAAAPLTKAERRAGYRRLAIAGALLIGACLLVGLVFMALGADVASGIGAGFGLVGIVLVIGGVVAFTRTGGIRRAGGDIRWASATERRNAERLALGLLGTGVLFSLVSLTVA